MSQIVITRSYTFIRRTNVERKYHQKIVDEVLFFHHILKRRCGPKLAWTEIEVTSAKMTSDKCDRFGSTPALLGHRSAEHGVDRRCDSGLDRIGDAAKDVQARMLLELRDMNHEAL